MVPRNNLHNRLEELEFPFELRATLIRLHGNVISKFRNTDEWPEDINCNIGVKHDCLLSPTLFGIYIDKLEACHVSPDYSHMWG
jgi:hypothetical protein